MPLAHCEQSTGSSATRASPGRYSSAPLVFVLPGELRHAEWSEIYFEAREWRISAEKMKMRPPHRVLLSRQAVAILREL
jgi:integrase